jgi:hypothetical protein
VHARGGGGAEGPLFCFCDVNVHVVLCAEGMQGVQKGLEVRLALYQQRQVIRIRQNPDRAGPARQHMAHQAGVVAGGCWEPQGPARHAGWCGALCWLTLLLLLALPAAQPARCACHPAGSARRRLLLPAPAAQPARRARRPTGSAQCPARSAARAVAGRNHSRSMADARRHIARARPAERCRFPECRRVAQP